MYISLVDEKKLLKYSVDYLSKYDSSKNNLVNDSKKDKEDEKVPEPQI